MCRVSGCGLARGSLSRGIARERERERQEDEEERGPPVGRARMRGRRRRRRRPSLSRPPLVDRRSLSSNNNRLERTWHFISCSICASRSLMDCASRGASGPPPPASILVGRCSRGGCCFPALLSLSRAPSLEASVGCLWPRPRATVRARGAQAKRVRARARTSEPSTRTNSRARVWEKREERGSGRSFGFRAVGSRLVRGAMRVCVVDRSSVCVLSLRGRRGACGVGRWGVRLCWVGRFGLRRAEGPKTPKSAKRSARRKQRRRRRRAAAIGDGSLSPLTSRSENWPWMSPHTVTGAGTGCTLDSRLRISLARSQSDWTSASGRGCVALVFFVFGFF